MVRQARRRRLGFGDRVKEQYVIRYSEGGFGLYIEALGGLLWPFNSENSVQIRLSSIANKLNNSCCNIQSVASRADRKAGARERYAGLITGTARMLHYLLAPSRSI